MREMRARLLIGIPLDRRLRRLTMILHSSAIVPPLRKVHSQFCCNLLHPLSISRLPPFTDPAMEPRPPSCRDLGVYHLPIQGVTKSIARCSPTVRHDALPTRLQEEVLPHQLITVILDLFHVAF